jgi:hypothetical protein
MRSLVVGDEEIFNSGRLISLLGTFPRRVKLL